MYYLVQFMSIFLNVLIVAVSANYNLSIVHFNDFHARYEPITNISTSCSGPNCIGGFSRLYATITQLKKQNPNSIVLSAGDNVQGTLWHIVHKWNVTQNFINKLPLDAMTLGNHEFDDGVASLASFLTHIDAPVVVSNIDNTLEPSLKNLYNRSIIVANQGKKIGIIGVLTSTTKLTSRTGNLIFEDESEAVNSEAQKLELEGVFTNIVLSHCGYEADIEIAKNSSSRITVIVGGHTDSFLYSGSTPAPSQDRISGPYPTVVLNKSGKKVLVVQASAHTKYLGNLTIIYNNFGDVTGWDGSPIYLGAQIPTDLNIDTEIGLWKQSVDLEGNKVVGRTVSKMLNKPCRSEECPLGNFATDAMLFHYTNLTEDSCKDPSIAIIHAGGMRAGLVAGNITFSQLITSFPFQDTINICTYKGRHIKEILESVIDNRHLLFPHLLQLSGLRVVFNISKPEGQRVQELKTCCKPLPNICENVASEKRYKVFLPMFLTDTSFNPLFAKYCENKTIGDLDSDIYRKYLDFKTSLNETVEGRIDIIPKRQN